MGDTSHKIMTKTLPDILDELEDAISSLGIAEEEAKSAAAEAREAGIAAGARAEQAAKAAVASFTKELANIDQLQSEAISSIKKQLDELARAVVTEAQAVDSALLSAKAKHVELSPLLTEP